MSFYAISRSIWLLRNDMVFNGNVFNFEKIIDIIKYRLASWFKVRWPDYPYMISDIVRFPKDIPIPNEIKVSKRNIDWEPSSPDFLKFNVDGSARGKPEPASIG